MFMLNVKKIGNLKYFYLYSIWLAISLFVWVKIKSTE